MKKIFRITLKALIFLALLLLLLFGIGYLVYDKKLPTGVIGTEADALAQKMLTALQINEYENTRFIEWSFLNGKHQYKWDKHKGKVDVLWSENKVILDLNNPAQSIVYRNNKKLIGPDRSSFIETAQSYFNNDSFWLAAPFKVFDKGTIRSIVTLKNNEKALLVLYTKGGSTPGDSYLWKLGPNGFPKSFQMWVSIIPYGGLEATWDDWQIMESGAFLPASHQLGPFTLNMGNVRAYP